MIIFPTAIYLKMVYHTHAHTQKEITHYVCIQNVHILYSICARTHKVVDAAIRKQQH